MAEAATVCTSGAAAAPPTPETPQQQQPTTPAAAESASGGSPAAGAVGRTVPSLDTFRQVDAYDLYNLLQNEGSVVQLVDTRALGCGRHTTRIRQTRSWVPPASPAVCAEMLERAHLERRASIPGRHVVWVLYDTTVAAHKTREWTALLAFCLKRQSTSIGVSVLSNGLDDFADMFPFLCEERQCCAARASKGRPISSLFSYPNIMVRDFLYLGNITHARNRDVVRSLRITHVVDASNTPGETFESSGVEYLRVNLADEDTSDLRAHFDAVYAFVCAAAKLPDARVLVHCRAGVSRSATLVIWYLMRHKELGVVEAWSYVRARRDCICPNLGFRRQLLEAEVALRGKSRSEEQSLREFGV